MTNMMFVKLHLVTGTANVEQVELYKLLSD
jgi:hypothetical protein